MRFKSKIDWWFYLGLGVIPIFLLVSLVPAVIAEDISWFWAIITLLLTLGLPCWIALTTDYQIDTETLLIRSGPFRWQIPLNDIQSVKPSRSILSSPALSMDRLAINYGNGRQVLVSPMDKDAFRNSLGE